jgi:hypothetical protein
LRWTAFRHNLVNHPSSPDGCGEFHQQDFASEVGRCNRRVSLVCDCRLKKAARLGAGNRGKASNAICEGTDDAVDRRTGSSLTITEACVCLTHLVKRAGHRRRPKDRAGSMTLLTSRGFATDASLSTYLDNAVLEPRALLSEDVALDAYCSI